MDIDRNTSKETMADMDCVMENASENDPKLNFENFSLTNRKRKNTEQSAEAKKVHFAISSPEVRIFDRSRTESPPPRAAILSKHRASFSSQSSYFDTPSSSTVRSSGGSTPLVSSTSRRSSIFTTGPTAPPPTPRPSFNSSLNYDQSAASKRSRYSSGGFGSSLQLQPPSPTRYNQWGSQNTRYLSLSPGKIDGHMVNSTMNYYPTGQVRLQRNSSFRSVKSDINYRR